MRSFLIALFVSVFLSACAGISTTGPHETAHSADTVILTAAVYTLNPAQPWASALAVRDGRILAVGSDDDMEQFIDADTRLMRLSGAMVLPGLHDAHVHPVWASLQQAQCDLTGLASVAEILQHIKQCAAQTDGEWILGGGYNPALFPNGAPHKQLLDEIVPDKSIYLDDTDGHGAWLNSRALRMIGITADTVVPKGGVIELDPQTGEPMGTLREGAVNLARAATPRPTLEQGIAAMKRSQKMANAFGLTSIIVAQGIPELIDPIYALAKSDELTLNVLASLHYGGEMFETPSQNLVANRLQLQTGRLQTHSAKIFADGVLEGGTAAMLEPYLGYGHRGSFLVEPDELKLMVQALDAQDVQAHIHAIGDAAVRASLDAVEYALAINGQRDNRHHFAHIQQIHPDDIPRFAQLNVTANVQSLWAYPDAYITDLNLPEIGEARVAQMYPFASIEKAGGRIAGGSDWSVSSLNPFLAIETAVTREDPLDLVEGVLNASERVSLETMLKAYTINAAYLMKQEHERGSLEAGKAADITVIDRNLFEVPVKDIGDTLVLYTFLDGDLVYARK